MVLIDSSFMRYDKMIMYIFASVLSFVITAKIGLFKETNYITCNLEIEIQNMARV